VKRPALIFFVIENALDKVKVGGILKGYAMFQHSIRGAAAVGFFSGAG
jgi:hypothetical protein